MLESKVIGFASSDRLGAIRIIVVLCAILNVVFQDFTLLGQAVGPWYQPEGFFRAIPAHWTGIFFNSEAVLLIFKAFLLIFLISALIGFYTRFSLLVSTGFYAFYLATLGSGAGSLDCGGLPLYLMFMLIWIPSGEGISLDPWRRRRREYAHLKLDDRPSVSIGWSVFLLRAVLAFSFFQAGLSKIQNTGWGWIRPWRLEQFFIQDSLVFSHAGWVSHLIAVPPPFWMLLAMAYLGIELFFPVILLVRNSRVLYLLAAVLVRSFVLIPQNIFFHDLILLQFIFYHWDRILPLGPASEHDRRKGTPFFRIPKV